MNSEELEQSLKAEFESHLNSVIAEMKQELAEFQAKILSDLDHQRVRMDEAFQGFGQQFESRDLLGRGFGELVSEHLKLARDEGARLAATAYSEAEKIEETAVFAAASTPANYSLVRDAIADISSHDSQAGILRALVDNAAQFATRGAFFIVKNEHFSGWRVFGDDSPEHVVREINFPVSANSIIGKAIRSTSSVEASYGAYDSDEAFLSPLNFGQPGRMFAIPLVARGRGVAVLYADSGHDGDAPNVEALQALVRVAGLTVEILASGQAVATDTPAPAPTKTTDPPSAEYVPDAGVAEPAPKHITEPEAVSDSESFAAVQSIDETQPSFQSEEYSVVEETVDAPRIASEEIHSYGEPVANVEPKTLGSSFEAVDDSPFAAAPPHEVYRPEPETQAAAEYPAREFQEEKVHPETPEVGSQIEPAAEYEPAGAVMFDQGAVVAPTEARQSPFERTMSPFEPAAPIGSGVAVTTEPAVEISAPVAPRGRLSDRNVDLPIEVPEEDRRMHNDARRFARLLVSEIKLYNEKKVLDGRQSADLYGRLKEAIDRSREMYDKRVQPPVAAKFDYFHYELVNSLAEGDDGKFGSGYPGAAV